MDRRTTFITAAAITGTLLAGSAAVAANVGILSAADNDNLGDLSVADTSPPTTLGPVEAQIIDVYIEDAPVAAETTVVTTAPSTTVPAPNISEFSVDVAGTVSIEQTDDGIVLDELTPADGWESTTEQSSPTSMTATFTQGDTTFVFYAEVNADGTIDARVEQPIVNVVEIPAPPSGQPPSADSDSGSVPPPAPVVATPTTAPSDAQTGGDDDHDDDQYEDDDHEEDQEDEQDEEDEEDEDEEHEGGEDDD